MKGTKDKIEFTREEIELIQAIPDDLDERGDDADDMDRDDRPVTITIRIPFWVIRYFKGFGPGYQRRLVKTLIRGILSEESAKETGQVNTIQQDVRTIVSAAKRIGSFALVGSTGESTAGSRKSIRPEPRESKRRSQKTA